MPSRYSSDHSISDAEDLVRPAGAALGRRYGRTMVDSFEAALSPARGYPDRAARGEPAGPGARHDLDGAVERARAPGPDRGEQERAGRGLLDAVRGFREAASGRSRTCSRRWCGSCPGGGMRRRSPGPVAADPGELDRQAASAELAPGEKDADSLPDYEVLDALLDDYVEKDMARAADRGVTTRTWCSGSSGWWTRPSQAPPVPAGPQDHPEELRPRSAAAITNAWRERLPGQLGRGCHRGQGCHAATGRSARGWTAVGLDGGGAGSWWRRLPRRADGEVEARTSRRRGVTR